MSTNCCNLPAQIQSIICLAQRFKVASNKWLTRRWRRRRRWVQSRLLLYAWCVGLPLNGFISLMASCKFNVSLDCQPGPDRLALTLSCSRRPMCHIWANSCCGSSGVEQLQLGHKDALFDSQDALLHLTFTKRQVCAVGNSIHICLPLSINCFAFSHNQNSQEART